MSHAIKNPILHHVAERMIQLMDDLDTGRTNYKDGDVKARAGYAVVKAVEVDVHTRLLTASNPSLNRM